MWFLVGNKPENGIGDDPDQKEDQGFGPDERQNDPHRQGHQVSDREA
jgi:hypothetical protein